MRAARRRVEARAPRRTRRPARRPSAPRRHPSGVHGVQPPTCAPASGADATGPPPKPPNRGARTMSTAPVSIGARICALSAEPCDERFGSRSPRSATGPTRRRGRDPTRRSQTNRRGARRTPAQRAAPPSRRAAPPAARRRTRLRLAPRRGDGRRIVRRSTERPSAPAEARRRPPPTGGWPRGGLLPPIATPAAQR